jgi:hypothetical protein
MKKVQKGDRVRCTCHSQVGTVAAVCCDGRVATVEWDSTSPRGRLIATKLLKPEPPHA